MTWCDRAAVALGEQTSARHPPPSDRTSSALERTACSDARAPARVGRERVAGARRNRDDTVRSGDASASRARIMCHHHAKGCTARCCWSVQLISVFRRRVRGVLAGRGCIRMLLRRAARRRTRRPAARGRAAGRRHAAHAHRGRRRRRAGDRAAVEHRVSRQAPAVPPQKVVGGGGGSRERTRRVRIWSLTHRRG